MFKWIKKLHRQYVQHQINRAQKDIVDIQEYLDRADETANDRAEAAIDRAEAANDRAEARYQRSQVDDQVIRERKLDIAGHKLTMSRLK